jgi:hypothetical protein
MNQSRLFEVYVILDQSAFDVTDARRALKLILEELQDGCDHDQRPWADQCMKCGKRL